MKYSIVVTASGILPMWTILQEALRAEVLSADYDFEAHKKLVPMQPGDVSALEKDFGCRSSTSLREGLRKFAEWYKGVYGM